MANADYMNGRRKYSRPQGMLWADNPGNLVDGIYLPNGIEVGASTNETDPNLLDQFIILSDDNRNAIDFSFDRIERKERMINGRMRSHHIADKLVLTTSWNMLPSRSFSVSPQFDADGKPTNLVDDVGDHTDIAYAGSPKYQDQQYTTDGGAGGAELLEWYENHQGSFWVYLAYDKYTNFGKNNNDYQNLNIYNHVVEMFFSDFTYSVQKRGSNNFDFWNISVSLEEV